MGRIRFKNCEIVWRPFGCTTYFPDGSETSNWPQENSDYEEIVVACGHRDKAVYTREHDLCHAFLSEKMFGRRSEVLWRSAHGLPPPDGADWEEKLIFYFQRFMHQRARAPDSMWIHWKQEALELCKQLNSVHN